MLIQALDMGWRLSGCDGLAATPQGQGASLNNSGIKQLKLGFKLKDGTVDKNQEDTQSCLRIQAIIR